MGSSPERVRILSRASARGSSIWNRVGVDDGRWRGKKKQCRRRGKTVARERGKADSMVCALAWDLKGSIFHHYLTFHALALAVRIAVMASAIPRCGVFVRSLSTGRSDMFLHFFFPHFSLCVSLQPTFPSPCPMGRETWCTADQTAFLQAYLPKLDEEKHNNGLTPFYARIAREFIERWPSPTPKKAVPEGVDPKQHADNERARVSSLDFAVSSFFIRRGLTSATSANFRLVWEPPQAVCNRSSSTKASFRPKWEKRTETLCLSATPSIFYLELSIGGLSTAQGGR